MNCPKCNMQDTRVLETRTRGSSEVRRRLCRNCGHSFPTLERAVVFDRTSNEYLDLEDAPSEPRAEPKKKQKKAAYHPVPESDLDALKSMTPEVVSLFLRWWNESRRSKWGSKAAWTKNAFESNLKRVGELPEWKQLALCEAGVECGWQALKVEYLSDLKPPAEAGLQPQSSAMQEAIERWNMQAQ